MGRCFPSSPFPALLQPDPYLWARDSAGSWSWLRTTRPTPGTTSAGSRNLVVPITHVPYLSFAHLPDELTSGKKCTRRILGLGVRFVRLTKLLMKLTVPSFAPQKLHIVHSTVYGSAERALDGTPISGADITSACTSHNHAQTC